MLNSISGTQINYGNIEWITLFSELMCENKVDNSLVLLMAETNVKSLLLYLHIHEVHQVVTAGFHLKRVKIVHLQN